MAQLPDRPDIDQLRRQAASCTEPPTAATPARCAGCATKPSIEAAMRPGHRLVARIRLTDVKGNPVWARVHPPALTWSAEKCG